MTAVAFVPPNVLPPTLQKFAGLLKRKWFRELVLAPPTVTRRRFSNKTEDYGVFKPSLIESIGQVSIYVQDIARSRSWYESLAGLRHSRTCEEEPHPYKPGWRIRCCYMSAPQHDECLVLVEERDPAGKLTIPSGMSFFHMAFELKGNRLEDVLAFADQAKTSGLFAKLRPGAPQWRASARRRRDGRQRRLLFLRSRLQQRRVLRCDGHDRELSGSLRRDERVDAGMMRGDAAQTRGETAG